jgi:uncharacterized zinc-type alcohol dehydrogenase-like protein
MKISAYASQTAKAPLTPFSYAVGDIGLNEVTLQVIACGICHSDVHMMDNDWGIAQFPIVPGHEVVGEVVEVGSAVSHLKKGMRVGVGWQRSACLSCPECLSGKENLCDANEGVIVGHHGGFASHVRVDSRFAFPLPEGIDSLHAGPLMCGGITVFSGLRQAGMTSGQRIGVIGVGGLGHMAVRFAKAMGNSVTAFTTSASKVEELGRMGADEVIVTEGGRLVKKPTKPLDIIISTVTAPLELGAYLEALGADGTLSMVGVGSETVTLPLMSLLGKRRRFMSSPIGGRGEITQMLNIAETFNVKPTIEVFPMAQANEAIDRVRKNSVRYRAVLKV